MENTNTKIEETGLTFLHNREKLDRIIVSGGGSHRFVEIVDKNENYKNRQAHLVVDENTKTEYIYLICDNASVEDERIIEVRDGAELNIYYCVITDSDSKVHIHNKIGKNSKINHRMLFFGSGEQTFDFKETHQFLSPDGEGKFLAHGFLTDKAKSNYDSTIVIDPHAQKVDSRLDLHSYLLSRSARSVMVPSLKIEANDVKAGHGATVSHVDDDTLFYLRSRGITEQQARKLFIDGLFQDFVNQFDVPNLQEAILNKLKDKYKI